MRNWFKRHLAATFSAVCALLIVGGLVSVYAQVAQQRLAQALWLDGDTGDVGSARGILISGWGSGTPQFIANDSDGHLQVDTLTGPGGLTDDSAFTPATSTVTMAGFEFDDNAPNPVEEGDGGAARMSANRNLYTTLRDAAGNERGVNVTAANELNVLESNSADIETAVQIIDDWDDSTSVDHAKVVMAQSVPQVPTAVACDDTGIVAFTANASDNRLTLWNTGTVDVCVRFGSATGADRTTLTTCTVVLGAYAGSGTPDVYETPEGMRIGGEVFCCDASAASSLAVTAWRNP